MSAIVKQNIQMVGIVAGIPKISEDKKTALLHLRCGEHNDLAKDQFVPVRVESEGLVRVVTNHVKDGMTIAVSGVLVNRTNKVNAQGRTKTFQITEVLMEDILLLQNRQA